VEAFFNWLNGIIWSNALIALCLGAGLWFTLRTRVMQVRGFAEMCRLTVTGQKSDAGVSSFQALAISMAGRMGIGNIAGVATAIAYGGPGAVFWMWVMGFLGASTSYIECTLAQIYKRRDGEHSFRGGPADYIRRGLGHQYNWLAVVYAICLLAAFGLGFNAFQGNTVAGSVQDSLGLSRYITGAVLAAITGVVIFGGIKRIAKAADVVVPVMALGYLALALIVILMNIGEIPSVIARIVSGAFGYEEAIAGGMGAAIAQGLRRGLFSNEAGLGSAPNVAATALVRHPVSQGITQSFSVFIDTIVICSCTAFIILLGDVYVPGAEGVDGVVLTQQSLASHFGDWSRYALTAAILLFSFSSIIYNTYLGENALAAITSSSSAIIVLRLLILALVFLGAAAPGATAVFFFSDPMMGILALVNLVAILMLFPIAMRVVTDFRAQLKAGVARPIFDPAKFPDLDLDREAWNPARWK